MKVTVSVMVLEGIVKVYRTVLVEAEHVILSAISFPWEQVCSGLVQTALRESCLVPQEEG